MQIRQIPLSQLIHFPLTGMASHPNAYVDQLAEDIKERGIKRPLIVRPVGDMFQVVAGLARWKGAIIAGLETVPSDVRQLTDDEAVMLSIQDNMCPVDDVPDLSPMASHDASDAELARAIEESRVSLAAETAEQTPTFYLDVPLPVEYCELFRADFIREDMIRGATELHPKADPSVCEGDFDRFVKGLNSGRLHLEGHLYAVNYSLLANIEVYLTPGSQADAFGAARWNAMSEERRAEAISYAEMTHPIIVKALESK